MLMKHPLQNKISEIILQICLIFIFLGVFFFTYASYVEGQFVQKQIKLIIDDLVDNMVSVLPPEMKKQISIQIKKKSEVEDPNMKIIDDKITEINNQLIKKFMFISIISIIMTGIAMYYLYKKYHTNLKDNFWHAFIVLCAVAGVEFIFLKVIILNYMTIDSTFVKQCFFEALEQDI